jgi:hypothetical protein
MQWTRKRLAVGVGLIVIVAIALAGTAIAAFPQDNVKLYTGCLTQGGTINYVKEGDSPLQPCSSPKLVVKLSGGDITSLTVSAPLTGGGTNGALTIGLDSSFTLPASCANGEVPKWNGTTTKWACGSDNDTTYSAGTGLDLSGTTFSVDSDYRLPQSCSDGEFAKRASGNWACGSPAPPSLGGFESTVQPEQGIPDDGNPHVMASVTVPAGNYLVIAKGILGSDENVDDFSATECTAAGDHVRFGSTVFNDDGGIETPIALTGITSVPAGQINLYCSADSGADGMSLEDGRIVAVRIGG